LHVGLKIGENQNIDKANGQRAFAAGAGVEEQVPPKNSQMPQAEKKPMLQALVQQASPALVQRASPALVQQASPAVVQWASPALGCLTLKPLKQVRPNWAKWTCCCHHQE